MFLRCLRWFSPGPGPAAQAQSSPAEGNSIVVALEELISVLAENWDDVLDRMDPQAGAELSHLVRRIITGDSDEIIDAAIELAPLLLAWLPAAHPAAAAARSGGYRRSGGPPGPLVSPTLLARLDRLGLRPALLDRDISGPEPLDPEEIWAGARRRLLQAPSMSAAQVTALGNDPVRSELIRLERDDGTAQWPLFQFGPDGALLPLVRRINEMLGAGDDPWGVADWWLGPNAWLDGVPAQLIGVLADEVLLATAGTMAED